MRTKMLNLAVNLIGRLLYQQNGYNGAAGQLTNALRAVKIRDHKISYFDVGNGQPVVFLHGLGSSSLSWLPTLLAPSKARRLALDQIGHGRSEKPPLQYRITDFVEYLEEFIEQLDLKKVDLVGNSMGGWVAARLAVKRPDLVRRLVLVCSAGLMPSPAVRAQLEQVNFAPRTFAETRAILSRCFYDKARYANPGSTAFSYMLRRMEANHATVERMVRAVFDPNEWLDEKIQMVRARTLVLWGREDELLPVEFAEQFATGISGARLEIFERCGHVPQIERAHDFNNLITEFLA